MRPNAKWNVLSRTIMAALTLAFAVAALADPVTEADVKKMTTGWLKAWPNRGGLKLAKAVKAVVPVKDDDGTVLFYGVQLDPEGFVLTSADDQLSPIVAFNDKGQFAEVQKTAPNAKRFEGNPLVPMTKDSAVKGLKRVGQLRETMRKGESYDRKQALKMAKNRTRWADLRSRAKDAERNPKQAYTTFVDNLNIRVPIIVQSSWSLEGVGNKACFNYYTPSEWREPDKAYRQNISVQHYCVYNDGKFEPIQWYIDVDSPMIVADTGPHDWRLLNEFPASYQEGLVTNAPAGCSAVTKAQIIRHWAHNKTGGVGASEWPMKFSSNDLLIFTQLWHNDKAGAIVYRRLRGGDGKGGPYDFSKMPLCPTEATITEEECRQIGALLIDCGLTNNMHYTPTGSAGLPDYWDVFGFLKLGGTMRSCLDAGCPITAVYPGRGGTLDPYKVTQGHSFIVDGYAFLTDRPDENGSPGNWFYHCNMGLGAVGNVWYSENGADMDDILDIIVGTDLIVPNNYRNSLGKTVSAGDRVISGRVLGTDMDPASVDVSSLAVWPIEGATVTAHWASDTTGVGVSVKSNARGIYAFIVPKSSIVGDYTIAAAIDGYDFAAVPENPLTLGENGVDGRNLITRVKALTATRGVFDIGRTDAVFKGAIVASGAYAVLDRGFCWGPKPNPTVANAKISLGAAGAGPFSARLSDHGFALTPGMVYHARAYATTTKGTAYGSDYQFRTDN